MELVVVVVLLGLLATLAFPLYANLKASAHKAAVADTEAAFKAAVGMVHLAWRVSGQTGAVDNLAGFGAGNVDVNAAGYPVDTSNANTPNAARCVRVWNGLLSTPPRAATTVASDPDYRVTYASQICTFTYLRDSSTVRRIAYNTQTGGVVATNP